MKTIGIVGSRRRNTTNDYQIVEREFLKVYEKEDSLVSGDCPKGADRFAELIAKKFSIPIKIYEAEWDKFGKGAGLIRNTYIAQDSDVLIACVSLDRTGGTEDTVRKFQKLGKTNLILC